jgi:PTS system mannose-specific IIA component
MIGGIVLTHGKIGEALIKAAESILGEVDNIHAISTTNLSLVDIGRRLRQVISSQSWEDGTMIMVSLMGGSCWNSGVGLARQLPKTEVVSGINLIMLISFLSKRDRYSLTELAGIIKEDSIRGIERYTGK